MSLALAHDSIWILSFGLTLLIEVAVMLGWRSCCREPWGSRALGPLVLLVVGLNGMTHPLGWLASSLGVPWLWCEVGVVFMEAVGLALIVPGVAPWDAGKLSILMNAASGTMGVGLGVILE
jgi:hypothetical protein